MYCSDYYRFILEYLEIEPQRKFEDIINNCETDNFMAVKNELQRAYRAKKYKEVAPLITAFRLGVYDTNSPVHLLNNDVISIIQEKLVQWFPAKNTPKDCSEMKRKILNLTEILVKLESSLNQS